MNTLKKITLCSLTLSLLLTSCSNDDAKKEEVAKEEVCNIVSFDENWYGKDGKSGTPTNSGFTFDAQGRVILAPTGRNQEISFEYYTDKIILKYVTEAPNSLIDYYTLNDKKQITHLERKAMMTFWGDTEPKNYMVLDYVYNEAGYLTAIKEGDKETTFIYADGNLITIKDRLNKKNADYTLTYDTNEPYQALPLVEVTPIYNIRSLHRIPTPINNTYGMAVLTSGGYFGKLPKNQIKSIRDYNFTYTKNDKKQVTKLTVVDKSTTIIDSTVYKINRLCK